MPVAPDSVASASVRRRPFRRFRISAAAPSRLALCLLLAVGLAACREPLYSNLSEQEANEVVATLARAGIGADKRAVDEKSWGVSIEPADMQVAMDALSRAGLPRERFATLGDLFRRDGIVPTPTEERVRFLYGISQELAHTLNEIDGVISSRVHIVLPENDPLSDRAKASSASVFIKHRADVDLQPMLPAIRSLVLRSVEGLSHDTVFVSLFPADISFQGRGGDPGVPLLGVSTLGVLVPRPVAAWLNPLLTVLLVAALAGFAWTAIRRGALPRRPGAPRPAGIDPSADPRSAPAARRATERPL